ncbi:MFS transporter [Tissierella pigra]|uniref:MFS transporter n=1 Tax=Tissierella pigra TaxID=2607614 RepID=A0A6N7XZD0_9FIRM|nr:MFS transporter [Tissierella pigra]MBU5425835.1 MFS transporter [Tissierella pigra]MSU01588.1 MFS transporter [Tissierella pigra]
MRGLYNTIYFISFPLSFIGFIFPIYASSIGANVIQIGYLYSIFSIISIIIRPIVGNLIDKRGRKTGILIGTILYTVVNVFFIMARDFKYLLIGRIIQSLGASFLWISVDTFISDISDKTNRGQNFGLLDQWMAKGEWIGSIIGFTILYNNFTDNPFRLIFIIFMVTSLASVYYTIKNLPETVNIKKGYEEGNIKNKKELKYFLGIIGVISLIISLTAPIYLLYLQEHITYDLSLITFLFIPASILALFLPKRFGSFSDKYGREKIVIVGMFINAILQILIPFNKGYYSFMILYTLISTIVMFYSPAFSSLIIDFVGEDKRGRSYGLYSFASGIGGAIGYTAGSYIYENIGNDIVFYTKGVLLLVMTLFICYLYIKNIRVKTEIEITRTMR